MSLPPEGCLRLFLAGDVMLGRGIDQIQRQSCDPVLYESYMRSAREYVALAERVSGPLPRDVAPGYVWGDLLADLEARGCDLRIVNLETALTTSPEPDKEKGIHYRAHPANVAVLNAAQIDACTLANNHMLDWGREGLAETLTALDGAGIARTGAGADTDEAFAPAILPLPGGKRCLVFALGLPDSGISENWAAGAGRPGVAWAAPEEAEAILEEALMRHRRPGDLVLCSLHWGDNWGYEVEARHRALAEALVTRLGVDIVFGHSAHHPKALAEIGGRLVLFGAGDLINDYEGIGGHDLFRPDLVLGYLADIRLGDGRLMGLEMLPYRLRRFRLERAEEEERAWLAMTMERECRRFGGHVSLSPTGHLRLEPDAAP